MARKKTTRPEPLPREQQPQFIEALKYLPADEGALMQLAGDMLELFNDAVRTNLPSQMESAALRYSLVVYRLNGDTFFGCAASTGSACRLQRHLAAPIGTVPGWGQVGGWLLEVDGMRIRVEVDPREVGGIQWVNLHAVDVAAPFLSSTGFRSCVMHPDNWLGYELGSAVRVEVERLLQGDGKPVAIDEHRRPHLRVPAWLSDALAGVTHNGQLAMPLNGEALPVPEPEKKAPLSNAERQRLFRKRRKEKSEAAKAGDFAALEVTDASLLSVWKGLPSDFDRAATALALLRQRNDQHFELARAVLTLQRRLKDAGLEEQAQDIKWRWNPTPLGDYRATSAPEYMERLSAGLSAADERANLAREAERLRGERAQLEDQQRLHLRTTRELSDARAEVTRLKVALQQIAQEVGGVPGTAPATAASSEVERLRAEVAALQGQNATEVADRGRAFEAVAVLQERLKKAGLVHDYRRQPGE